MILKELYSIESKADKLKFICERGNRAEILKEKKSLPKNTDPFLVSNVSKSIIIKAPIELEDGEVMIVGNSVGFMDSHDDVSMKGSWNKTVKERGNRVPILKDHVYTVDSAFAENLGAFVTDVSIQELGYSTQGYTEVLGAKIRPDADMYNKYESKIIKEHSVGLQYMKIGFAVNDESEEEGYKEWLANIDKVINRERAEELGYFFPVYEQKLIEFSAVVFGSNSYTPAFTNKSLEKSEPSKDTQKEKEPTQTEKGYEFLKNLNF